jgi:hypothetical protein
VWRRQRPRKSARVVGNNAFRSERACCCSLLLRSIARPHGLHSNVRIGGKSAWDTVRANCIVSRRTGKPLTRRSHGFRLSPTHKATHPVAPSFSAPVLYAKSGRLAANRNPPFPNRSHMGFGCAAIDLFVVPTIAFQQLFAFLVLGLERRRLLWFAVTRNPTAEWLARQITEAFPWDKCTKISHSRQRPSVRRRIHGSRASDGYPGQTHVVPLAMAKWIC